MRNVLKEAPTTDLHGIPLAVAQLIDDDDIDGRDVLDVGCGFGWFELLAVARGARSVVGIDLTESDLATARANVAAAEVRFQAGSAVDLPFADGSFDTVVCIEVLEHLPPGTERRAFREMARVLRNGGRLVLSTPHASFSARLFDPAWWLIAHRHYTTRELAMFARDSGLEVDRLELRGGRWFIISLLDLYVAKWIFRRPPFYKRCVDRRVDEELRRADGSAGCFMTARRQAAPGPDGRRDEELAAP